MNRPTRLPRYAPKSVAPLDPAALVIGSVGDVAAGLKVEWVPHHAERSIVTARGDGWWLEHHGDDYFEVGVGDKTDNGKGSRRDAVLVLATKLRDMALKAIPLAQSGAGAACDCAEFGNERDHYSWCEAGAPSTIEASRAKLEAAVDKAPKPTPAEVAKARGIRVGDRVRVVKTPSESFMHTGAVGVVSFVHPDLPRANVDVEGYIITKIFHFDEIEILPTEAPAFEWPKNDWWQPRPRTSPQ